MKITCRPTVLTRALLPVAVCAGLVVCSTSSPQLPDTSVRPVTDVYHDVEVVDNYRWLEDSEDSEVRKWDSAQNSYARWILDNIPQRSAIAERLQVLYNQSSPEYYYFRYQEGVLFALKEQPPKEQPLLVSLASPFDLSTERIVLDPNVLDTSGMTSVDFYVVSRDASMVAVSLSRGGTEDGDVYVYDVARCTRRSDFVPRVNGPTAGGDIAWKADGSGFYYTHYPREHERPPDEMRFYQQVYFHKLGTPTEEDSYVIGKEFPKIAEIEFETSEDLRYVVATVANGDGGQFAHYLLGPSGEWEQITQFEDLIPQVRFGPDNSLYLLSHKNAPRGKILRLPAGETRHSRAMTVVSQSDAVIRSFLPTATWLYVRDILGGPSQIRIMDLAGHLEGTLPLLPISSVWGMTQLDGDQILFTNSSYTEPAAVYLYDPADNEPRRTAMYVTSPADFSNVEVVREHATSKDGTQVPMNIIRRKGITLDGSNPTILYGYGGYGSSQTPWFDHTLSIWLDNGGVYVVANIRGGGEFGEDWHLEGNLTHKQNVFDDFSACAQRLIEVGYANPSKLAIKGGSNGGLLVAATMTQHPELFRAVICMKGVLDMLRFEVEPNGAFNVTEYGSVTDPNQFNALYAYSPYHNVVDKTRYPEVLFTADVNDGRVSPSNSRKMAARLQAATVPGALVLLRMSSGVGHGRGSSLSRMIAQKADVTAFLFDRLGVKYTAGY
jgi:prolyl oligopeptidase